MAFYEDGYYSEVTKGAFASDPNAKSNLEFFRRYPNLAQLDAPASRRMIRYAGPQGARPPAPPRGKRVRVGPGSFLKRKVGGLFRPRVRVRKTGMGEMDGFPLTILRSPMKFFSPTGVHTREELQDYSRRGKGYMATGIKPAVAYAPTKVAPAPTGLGALGFSFKKMFKITPKTFAKLKPAGIFKTALNVVAPGSVTALTAVSKYGKKGMDAVARAKEVKKQIAKAKQAISSAPTQAERIINQEILLNATRELKSLVASTTPVPSAPAEAPGRNAEQAVPLPAGGSTPAEAVQQDVQAQKVVSALEVPSRGAKPFYKNPFVIGGGILAVLGGIYLVTRKRA